MRILWQLLIVLMVGAGILLWQGLQRKPLVRASAPALPHDSSVVEELLKVQDPRRIEPGTSRTLSLNDKELSLVADHVLNRYGKGGAEITVERNRIDVKGTLELPSNPLGNYLNLRMSLVESDGFLRMTSFRVGRLSFPVWFVERMWINGLRLYAKEALDAVKRIAVTTDRVEVTYQWRVGLLDRMRKSLLADKDTSRLRVFHEKLVQTTRGFPPKRRVALTRLMTPLFELAAERSETGDPVADNRAVLVVLALYVTERDMASLVPDTGHWPSPTRVVPTLRGRLDLARHFVTSAALGATGGSVLSDAVGLYKEIADSRRGKGFSFRDLAADRAGTRFGRLAAENAGSARRLQRLLSEPAQDGDFMPNVESLPDFVNEKEFQHRFGPVGSPAYDRIVADIDRRIAACSFYRRG